MGNRAMAMGFQWSLCSAVVLLSLHAAHSPESARGLSCVNDFVTSVTCTWRHSAFNSSSDCWLSGVKTTYDVKNGGRPKHVVRRCKLEQREEFQGCTFSFDTTFNPFEKMPNISVRCNGTLVEAHQKYKPVDHIKLNPPSAPTVNSSVNVTRISWSPGGPPSQYLTSLKFQVQIKQIHQSWNEVNNETTEVPKIVIWNKLKGHLQVRVRAKPDISGSHWSNWSPVTSWKAHDEPTKSQTEDTASLSLSLTLTLALPLLFASVIASYICYIKKRLMKEKTVPNPSKYFCTLHSVHGGNLKKWLNPVSVSDTVFMSRPREDISAVEVCDSWAVVPASPPCCTSTLLHPSSGENRHSSCSSSCFSNMGYFMSSSNGSSSHTCTKPYFTHQDSMPSTHMKLSPCSPFASLATYESLRRDLQSPPQSPDSGFGMGKFEDQGMEILDDNHRSPLLLLHVPPSVSSFPPASPPFPLNVRMVFDNEGLEEDAPTAASPAGSGNLSAWPVAEPMCRASSFPVDSSKSGYLTLKELQTTFSNKSI